MDERMRPGIRAVWGARLTRSLALDAAVTHVRLGTLDLTGDELARVARLRVLVAELSAASLDAEAHALAHRAGAEAGLGRLLALLEEGRLLVRSAPLGGWAPDFSIFHDGAGPRELLVGPHRFDGAVSLPGTALRLPPRAEGSTKGRGPLRTSVGQGPRRGGGGAGGAQRSRKRGLSHTRRKAQIPCSTTVCTSWQGTDLFLTPCRPDASFSGLSWEGVFPGSSVG